MSSQFKQLHILAGKQYNIYNGWPEDDSRGLNHMLPLVTKFYEALALRIASEQLHKATEDTESGD
jgi:hypothetical protein